jgi:integrase
VSKSRRGDRRRRRVGRVSYYEHHGSWWVYYRDAGAAVRRKVGHDEASAERVAAQLNAQLASEIPTQFSFRPATVVELRSDFLDFHEHVVRSSLATVSRYRAATQHLVNFVQLKSPGMPAHELNPEAFVRYLRTIRISPNGHPNSRRRPLRDKGVRFILETCRALYGFGARQRCMPPTRRILSRIWGENESASRTPNRCSCSLKRRSLHF